MSAFEGILPAIITPMHSDGSFNEEAFRRVMEFNIEAGVHGFWIAGGTGESILLTDEENMRIATASADQSRGRVNNIMHVGAATTERAARLAEHAAGAGVEAICCVPPFSTAGPTKRSPNTIASWQLRRTCPYSSTTCPSPRVWRSHPH